MSSDLNALAKKIDNVATGLAGRVAKQALAKAGVEGKKLADAEVKSDLGDMSMSNWRRGKPIQIKTRFDNTSDTSITIKPASRAGGPMKVLQDGRSAGTSRKGRPVSASRGRGTWGRATEQMDKKLPEVIHDEVVKYLGKMFGR